LPRWERGVLIDVALDGVWSVNFDEVLDFVGVETGVASAFAARVGLGASAVDRYAYSFLYAFGGQGGRDSTFGRLRGFLRRSHANCAHAYVRAISSSGLRLLALLFDWARREMERLVSSEGRAPAWVGIRPVRTRSTSFVLIEKSLSRILVDECCWIIIVERRENRRDGRKREVNARPCDVGDNLRASIADNTITSCPSHGCVTCVD